MYTLFSLLPAAWDILQTEAAMENKSTKIEWINGVVAFAME